MSAPATRGTSNTNARGNTRDRAARRAYLLERFGDGVVVPCYRFGVCGTVLDDSTLTVDRIVPGRDGGTYQRNNIRPACGPCNSETGGALATRPAELEALAAAGTVDELAAAVRRVPAPRWTPDHTAAAQVRAAELQGATA